MKANDLSQFTFTFAGAGHYYVTYTTECRHDYWKALITDMEIIDATKNAEWVKSSDIRHLRDVVKRLGTHYNKHGERID